MLSNRLLLPLGILNSLQIFNIIDTGVLIASIADMVTTAPIATCGAVWCPCTFAKHDEPIGSLMRGRAGYEFSAREATVCGHVKYIVSRSPLHRSIRHRRRAPAWEVMSTDHRTLECSCLCVAIAVAFMCMYAVIGHVMNCRGCNVM